MVAEEHEGRRQTDVIGKASSESPALKPYRGKPAVRNFRGGDGNVGIIRSPVRAIALPDCRKGSSESILTSSLAGGTARCFLKRRPEVPVGRAIELRKADGTGCRLYSEWRKAKRQSRQSRVIDRSCVV
jgi:hypothetical protein